MGMHEIIENLSESNLASKRLIHEAMCEINCVLEVVERRGKKSTAWRKVYDRLSASYDKIDVVSSKLA